MSNPVQKENLENVLANNGNTDVISPTLFVLLMYLRPMITAYIFYSYERAKGQVNFIKKTMIVVKTIFGIMSLRQVLLVQLVW